MDRLASPEGNLSDVTEALQAAREGTYDAQQKDAGQMVAEQADWNQKLDGLMDAVFYSRKEEPIGKAVARTLYGTLLEGSVTRLEQFAACSYAHFLQYGLRLKEREEYGLQAVDMGNVFHDALKYFSDKIEASEYDWFHVPEEKRTAWMEEALEHALQICAEKGLGEEGDPMPIPWSV